MRVRVIRLPDPTSSEVKLVVQRWCAGQWEFVQPPFALNESVQANEFALRLSMTKREPAEMAVFEDGQKLVHNTIVAPAAKSEDIIDRLLRENAAANAALPDYEEIKP